MGVSLVEISPGLSTLLVEDNPGDVQLFRMALRYCEQPVQLHVSTTGEEALERLASMQAKWPDLVVLDLKLPGLGGLEVLERIRHDRRSVTLPVFILSGSTTPEEVCRAYELGANGYFAKSSHGLDKTVAAIVSFAAHVERPASLELPPSGEILVSRDGGGRRQAEERSNAELEQFAYVASHDLREPLRMVASFAGMLQEEHQSSLGDEAQKCLRYILGGVSRMDKLVRDLLTYARVGTAARRKATEVDRVLETALANLHVTVRRLRPEIERQPMPVVLGDETELVQLFQNLLDNALEFHRQLPPKIRIEARREGKMWLFAVRDDGIGIPAEHHKRIFQVFQRLSLADTDSAGTGIGLAVTKRIVEAAGGQIWVESKPGEGSSFYFTLPAVEPAN